MEFVLQYLWEVWQVYIEMAKPWNLSGPSNLIDFLLWIPPHSFLEQLFILNVSKKKF